MERIPIKTVLEESNGGRIFRPKHIRHLMEEIAKFPLGALYHSRHKNLDNLLIAYLPLLYEADDDDFNQFTYTDLVMVLSHQADLSDDADTYKNIFMELAFIGKGFEKPKEGGIK